MIRVLLVDDQPLIRAGFRALLEAEDDIEVVAEAADGSQGVALAAQHVPDVALVDVQMPVLDGIEATRRIAADPRMAGVHVVILTNYGLDEYVFAALRAGASGFLVKDTPPDELVVAVRHAAQGRPVLSPEVTRRLIDRVAGAEQDTRRDAARRKLDSLAERERTVAIEIGAGRSNAEIAALHHIGLATVKTHVSAILAKLDLTNRVQVAVLVHDAGLDTQGR